MPDRRPRRPAADPEVLGWRDGRMVALDQGVLPHEVRYLLISTVDQLVDAIARLAIRGAPVLGAAGALGVSLAVWQAQRDGWDRTRLVAEIDRIRHARPTAVNLDAGVSAIEPLVGTEPQEVQAAALHMVDGIAEANRALGLRGAAYLREVCGTGRPLRVHTHCNTGSLACLGWGTALGVVRALHAGGDLDHVVVDETRPLLQGARLTCWELAQQDIDHYLICDGAGPFVIARGLVDAVVVGADRVAMNGDVANKIGTYSLALAARAAGIPFLVAAPESTVDPMTPTGAAIPVEQRPANEVSQVLGVSVAPPGTQALNYAFDITPAELVTALVTEDRLLPGARLPAEGLR